MMEITFEKWKEPNESIVRLFANAFDISFHKDEEELNGLFSPEIPLTDDIIILRVRRLNTLYHTYLWEEHIQEIIEFLKREKLSYENIIHTGSTSAVKMLAARDNRNCFVFATKYCSFVEAKKYPIYDSLVASVLTYFHKKQSLVDGELDFERIRQKCEYETFKSIVDVFRKQYGLENCSYKDVDKFLWLVGKNA